MAETLRHDGAYQVESLIAEDIDAYLASHQNKTLLRFITCGSVDDGKSTLIGRLLYDSKMIFDDQLAALEADSRRVGTQGQAIDFALLVDGAGGGARAGHHHRCRLSLFHYGKTQVHRRRHARARTIHTQHGHGASTADLAVILVDARKGVLTQTRRHSYLCHLIGIRNLVLAVNKMDLVGYDQATYDAIVTEYADFATSIGIAGFTAMPISGSRATISPCDRRRCRGMRGRR